MKQLIVKCAQTQEVIDRVSQIYAVGANSHTLGAMRSIDPCIDPVAAQYIPQSAELIESADERRDPIGDHAHSPVKGIVHRYPDRVLYKVTSVCPVYCRYCFRKTMVGPEGETLRKAERQAALDYIAGRSEIWEVILTGGDPLMLSPRRLEMELQALEAMDHVQVIRLHSRCPVADPARIDAAMVAALSRTKATYLVMHINHPQDITPDVRRAVEALRRGGIMLLSQSVLLRGVNDDAAVLETLFRDLVSMGVKPYMLHHPDKAPGTAHFRVSIADGQRLMRALRGRVSGLCLPEYMLDIPGGYGKVPLTPPYCQPVSDATGYQVTDFKGRSHYYE